MGSIMQHRVVVTGMGAVTPLGNTMPELWSGLLAGKSGAGPVTRFETEGFSCTIACELKDFDPSNYFDRKEQRRMDLNAHYALAASQEAIDDSGLDLKSIDPYRCGVIVGSGIGGIDTFEKQHRALLNSGPRRVSPFFIPMMIIDMAAGLAAMRFGFKGPNYSTVSACASSAHALGDAFHHVQRGAVDIMLSGGTEATITASAFAGFCANQALSSRNDDPARASRPFDVDRDGFVMGEGSGMLVLESLEHAQNRGATIYGEIRGVGMTADAYHMTAPEPNGDGATNAMRIALETTGISPDEIDHINTHGTSTGLGDIAETKAIKNIFNSHAKSIAINSTKSMTGHLLGAAGAVEMIGVLKALETGWIPPTINLDTPDPECDLDYTPKVKRKVDPEIALSNSFGFGGHNVTVVARRFSA
jgi:3-oxoacyl-[acyl-carrier-protein] synthase II